MTSRFMGFWAFWAEKNEFFFSWKNKWASLRAEKISGLFLGFFTL
jgi:hypothetical protein